MESESLRKMARWAGTRGWMFKAFSGKNLRLFGAGPVVIAFLLSQTGFPAEFCSRSSAIDQVPFFIGQTYFDILDGIQTPRASDLGLLKLKTRTADFANRRIRVSPPELANGATTVKLP